VTEPKPWLSLPDEEPPERGFAELMAAARMKAEVMANPPWWKRLFDVLRRPPVLALATIMVLLGGVIVVGHHPDQVQAPAPPRSEVIASPPPAEPGSPPAATPAAEAVAPPVVTPPVVAPKHIAKRPPVAKPEPHALEQTKLETKTMDSDAAAEADDEAPMQKGAVQKANAAPDPLARCRAAAARKDCAGVKTCVQQLPATSRANATRDAALKSCL
jgi:hypothetical protein